MILDSAPVNEAILSNVGAIGEFRIRNSAKAFSILSSGLYANKVRAIIRELSCNAVDSHVAAGKQDTPFDIHLPNQLEPWFSIRDYGVGLSHEDVVTIYTTYFESTKTGSNDFIGALGLGSKSPFSYTDNFTVAAVKNGRKGIYSAFINEMGVPSIALMMEEESSEPSGVEIKFSVESYNDFFKFRDEAQVVFTYFKLRPVVSGNSRFEFYNVEYKDKDIIPGVHSVTNRNYKSTAVMGNIAYSIAIPESDTSLGNLKSLLECGLEIHFAIGELDFQASREGLSYIPQTILAIKSKLEALNTALTAKLASEADVIPNLWDRAVFLMGKKQDLWGTAVAQYVTDTKFPLLSIYPGSVRPCFKTFKVSEAELLAKYNIVIRGFSKGKNSVASYNMQKYVERKVIATGVEEISMVSIDVNDKSFFVTNDTNVGALERAKYHWRTIKDETLLYTSYVYVLEASDKTKPIKSKAFFKLISNPPKQLKASSLLVKERKNALSGKNVTIMRLSESSVRNRVSTSWVDAGKVDSFDAAVTFYYLPLSGFSVESKLGKEFDLKGFHYHLKGAGFGHISIYGVRKTDIAYIKEQPNWINIEDYLSTKLGAITLDEVTNNLIPKLVDNFEFLKYNSSIVSLIKNPNSPFITAVERFRGLTVVDKNFNEGAFEYMCNRYATTFDVVDIKKNIVDECSRVYSRYPLFSGQSTYNLDAPAIAEYVNLIDESKGV